MTRLNDIINAANNEENVVDATTEVQAEYEEVETPLAPAITAKSLNAIMAAKKKSAVDEFVEETMPPILERIKEKALEGRNFIVEAYEPNADFRKALCRELYELGFSLTELEADETNVKAKPRLKIQW